MKSQVCLQTLVLLLLIHTITAVPSWAKYGPEYEAQTAAKKSDSIWSEVVKDTSSSTWYNSFQMAGLLVESMSPSLNFVGDTFEAGTFGARAKYIHTVGNVAKVKFVPIANKEGYTGLFATGADHGFVRLSAAKQPDTSKTSAAQAEDNFAPGLGLKFLRDKVPSANLVAMYSVNGQPSWNFFANKFSNHISPATGSALAALSKKFSTGTPYIQTVGLSDFASINQDGTKVANPKFPFKLVFEPTEDVKNRFPETYSGTYFTEQLKTIASGTKLYNIYAVENPDSGEVLIGQLVTTSELTPSKFGDQYLFFKHQDMRDDLAINPQWKDKTPSYDCPFLSLRNLVKKFME